MKSNYVYPALLLWAALATAQSTRAPQSFATPDAAAKALLSAAENNDTAALIAIMGPQGRDLVLSGDPVQDKNRRAAFAERARQKMKVQTGKDSKRATVLVGDDAYPFPIPIVRTGTAWRFDPHHGKRELLARRIGANEIDAIDLSKDYVEAQYEFAAKDPERSSVHQYAQRFISSPGMKDGLYWPETAGDVISPVSTLVTEAAHEGYDVSGAAPIPYRGYRYRMLTAQGPDAEGGARDYLVRGLMIGGFGMVAWPAEYGASGIKTFMVNQSGVVYEKDLGPNTEAAAAAIRRFNPDGSWKPVK